MLTIKGVFDGEKIELLEEVPFKEKKKVVVTFLDDATEKTGLEMGISPIESLKGCTRGSNLTEKLLISRREDLEIEERYLSPMPGLPRRRFSMMLS